MYSCFCSRKIIKYAFINPNGILPVSPIKILAIGLLKIKKAKRIDELMIQIIVAGYIF
jgi:hypothetical protein